MDPITLNLTLALAVVIFIGILRAIVIAEDVAADEQEI